MLNALYYSVLNYRPENMKRLHEEFELTELPTPADDTDSVLRRTEILFAPLGYLVDAAKMDRCPRLKAIVSNTTGHPHIDVDSARKRGVFVACLKFSPKFLETITPTAERTWGLIIAVTRNMRSATSAVLDGIWDRRPFGAPRMLSNMRLGIVGHGRLGSYVARYGCAFGMTVGYNDPNVYHSSVGAKRYNHLHELAANSDVLSVHVPHERDTEGLISRSVMESMPKGSYIINTARGEVLDLAALLNLLDTGHLSGAGLDVLEGEFVPGFAERFPEHPILSFARNHNNLLITPHIGGSTVDAWRSTENHVIDMVLEHLHRG